MGRASALSAERPPRILAVDDTPTNVKVLEAVLAPRGYTVLAAGFDGYLAKPLDVRRFPEQVRQFCERAPGPPGRPAPGGRAEST